MAKKSPLSRGEKWMIFWFSAFVVIAAGTAFWLQESNTNPVVSIPTPVMPSPNAQDSYLKALDAFVPYRIPITGGTYPLTFSSLEEQLGDSPL